MITIPSHRIQTILQSLWMSLASNDGLGPGVREVSPVSSVSFDLFELNDPFIEMIYWFTMNHWTMVQHSDDLVLGVFLLSWNIHWSSVSQDAAPRCRDGGPAQPTWGTCGQAQGQTGGGEVLRSLRFCWTESPPKSPFLSGSTLKSALGHFLEGSRSSRVYLPEIGQLSEKFSTFALWCVTIMWLMFRFGTMQVLELPAQSKISFISSVRRSNSHPEIKSNQHIFWPHGNINEAIGTTWELHGQRLGTTWDNLENTIWNNHKRQRHQIYQTKRQVNQLKHTNQKAKCANAVLSRSSAALAYQTRQIWGGCLQKLFWISQAGKDVCQTIAERTHQQGSI